MNALSLAICKQFVGYEFLCFIPISLCWSDVNDGSEENQIPLHYKQSTEPEPLDINVFWQLLGPLKPGKISETPLAMKKQRKAKHYKQFFFSQFLDCPKSLITIFGCWVFFLSMHANLRKMSSCYPVDQGVGSNMS